MPLVSIRLLEASTSKANYADHSVRTCYCLNYGWSIHRRL